jgi:hypothetical protein
MRDKTDNKSVASSSKSNGSKKKFYHNRTDSREQIGIEELTGFYYV